MKLTANLHQVPGLRMHGAIPHLPDVLSWHAQRQFYTYSNIAKSNDIFH